MVENFTNGPISPGTIARYFKLQSCRMFLNWKHSEPARDTLDEHDWQTTGLGPLFSETGEDFERTQLSELVTPTTYVVGGPEHEESVDVALDLQWSYEPDDAPGEKFDRTEAQIADTLGDIASRRRPNEAVLYQAPLRADVLGKTVGGFSDILIVESPADGELTIDVLEVKSSSSPKVDHQIQAATYTLILESICDNISTTLNQCSARVISKEAPLGRGLIEEQTFNLEPRQIDVRLFLRDEGILDDALDYADLDEGFDDLRNKIAPRCSNCSYEPVCMTRAVRKEGYGLELLGLNPGTQRRLERAGVESLREFSQLLDIPNNPIENVDHDDFHEIQPRDGRAEATLNEIRERTSLRNLQTRIQIAHRFYRELESDSPSGDYMADPLQGSGYNLPDDSRGDDDEELNWADYPQDSLVRVYLHVQHDPILDSITLLSAEVECTGSDYDEPPVVESVLTLPDDPDDRAYEEDLIRSFFGQLGHAIADCSPDIAGAYPDYGSDDDDPLYLTEDHGYVHLYFYSRHQRDRLVEAVKRHPHLHGSPSIRRLLGFRRDIDQGMVSIIQDELSQRHALRFPGLGIIQTALQFRRFDDGFFDWTRDRPSGIEFQPSDYFGQGLFDSAFNKYHRPIGTDLDHSEFLSTVENGVSQLRGGNYPVINRETDQIPPEYVWRGYNELEATLGVDTSRLDDDDDVDSMSDDEKEFLEDVREFTKSTYRLPSGGYDDVTEEDLRLFAQQLACAVKHIERSVSSRDGRYEKDQLNVNALSELEPQYPPLAETCIEYQQLEFGDTVTAAEAEYRRPLARRLEAGESLLFRCDNVADDPDTDRGNTGIAGTLVDSTYNEVTGRDLATDPISVDEGDWGVITRVDPTAPEREEQFRWVTPESIKHSPAGTISELNLDDGSIEFNALWPHGKFPSDNYPYMVNHNRWDSRDAVDPDGSQYQTQVVEDEYYVVDSMVDDITGSRAHDALTACIPDPGVEWDEFDCPNTVYDSLNEIYRGGDANVHIDKWDEGDVNDYLEELEHRVEEADAPEVNAPNGDQEEFVTLTDNQIVTLQGPPGTGKTSTTTAPSIVSRVAAAEGDHFLTGLVTAYSHEAVNEVLSDVHDLLDFYSPADDVRLVRVNPADIDRWYDDVDYIDYYDDDDEDDLVDMFNDYVVDENPTGHVIFFGPPVSLRGFMDRVAGEIDATVDTDNIEPLYNTGDCALFDLVVVDEASMMDLPLLFLAGAFLADDGQLQLIGDHQQMQPIQKHDWESEDRQSLEEHTPYLSVLDFIRFLRGELEERKEEFFTRDSPDWGEIGDPGEDKDDLLPLRPITITYRLPPESAQMHTDLIYWPRDRIELDSRAPDHRINIDDRLPEAIDYTLNPEHRVTLLVHDDEQGTTYSNVEAGIIRALLSEIDIGPHETTPDDADPITTGVVVPYNDQAALVRDEVENDNVTVNTVETFQGDQRNLMVLSMTGSDPGHVTVQNDFLLDPHRFNVGASRMQQKVVILASKSLFQAVTPTGDTEDYNDQTIWKDMYKTMGGLDPEAGRDFDLGAFTDGHLDDEVEAQTTVTVYNGWPF